MAKRFLKQVRHFILTCVLLIGLITIVGIVGGCGSTSSSEDYVGVWEIVSKTEYDDVDGCITEDFDDMGIGMKAYIKITATSAQPYLTTPDKETFTCESESISVSVSGNTITINNGEVATYSISGNTFTIYEDTVEGCAEKIFFTRASESDIENAIEDCDLFDGDSAWPLDTEPLEYDVGPEGGVIEVMDYSSVHGLKIEIPEGALAQTTKIKITRNPDAPALPDGLDSSYYPVIGLDADAPFLKEIQIHFPMFLSPEDSENILCAFYWDNAKDRWAVVMPESIGNGFLTIKTRHFSLWQYGELIIDEADDEAMGSLYDVMYGENFFDILETFIEDEFDLLSFANYCDNQQQIYEFLLEKKRDAKDGVGVALTAISEVCNVCG